MRKTAGNTIVKVSLKGNPTPHPDAIRGLLFGKATHRHNRAFRNAICQDCGAQDKYVRDNRCLSRLDCIYRQLNWKDAGTQIPPWYDTQGKGLNIDRLTKKVSRFMSKHKVSLTEEEWDRQRQFFEERFGVNNGSS